jgi:hypothetical protein
MSEKYIICHRKCSYFNSENSPACHETSLVFRASGQDPSQGLWLGKNVWKIWHAWIMFNHHTIELNLQHPQSFIHVYWHVLGTFTINSMSWFLSCIGNEAWCFGKEWLSDSWWISLYFIKVRITVNTTIIDQYSLLIDPMHEDVSLICINQKISENKRIQKNFLLHVTSYLY